MKKIIGYLKSYYLNEFKWSYVLAVIGLLSVAIYFNYGYTFSDGLGLEDHFVDKYARTPKHFYTQMLMYGVVFILSYLLYSVFYKKYDFLKKWQFWGLTILALALFSFKSSFYGHFNWVDTWQDYGYQERKYWKSIVGNMFKGTLMLIPIGMYWWFNDRNNQSALYGFSAKGVDFKPYWVMLAGMSIIVAGAVAWDNDFTIHYPKAMRYGDYVDAETITGLKRFLFYEIWYGYDFIFIEHFFRGFLVLAFAKYVGRGAIIPMVSFYVLIHFGKPMMETVSSFFGGLILGVIAYESKSIYGGILVHMGVAWLMEYGAFIGRAFFKSFSGVTY